MPAKHTMLNDYYVFGNDIFALTLGMVSSGIYEAPHAVPKVGYNDYSIRNCSFTKKLSPNIVYENNPWMTVAPDGMESKCQILILPKATAPATNIVWRIGYVQTVFSDEIRAFYDTSCMHWPGMLQQGECGYGTDTFYNLYGTFLAKPSLEMHQAYISDRPDCVIPAFNPMTGAVSDVIVFQRVMKFRTWLAARKEQPGLPVRGYFGHFDWGIACEIKFTRTTSLSADIAWEGKYFTDGKPLAYNYLFMREFNGGRYGTWVGDFKPDRGRGHQSLAAPTKASPIPQLHHAISN